MFQLAARFVTNQSVYISLCSRNHSLMVVTFSIRTVTFESKIGNYRKSFLTSFKNQFNPPQIQLKQTTVETNGQLPGSLYFNLNATDYSCSTVKQLLD